MTNRPSIAPPSGASHLRSEFHRSAIVIAPPSGASHLRSECRIVTSVSAIVLLIGLALPSPARAQGGDWMLGPFTKPRDANPVLTPRATSTFRSPMSDSVVHWEEYAAFNPAAAVRDGKVIMLYRAEDASGDKQIGHHTSRLGMAESSDG